jgi:hypothetical protein
MAAHIVVARTTDLKRGYVAGGCDAGSPGSGGASPYLRRVNPLPQRLLDELLLDLRKVQRQRVIMGGL